MKIGYKFKNTLINIGLFTTALFINWTESSPWNPFAIGSSLTLKKAVLTWFLTTTFARGNKQMSGYFNRFSEWNPQYNANRKNKIIFPWNRISRYKERILLAGHHFNTCKKCFSYFSLHWQLFLQRISRFSILIFWKISIRCEYIAIHLSLTTCPMKKGWIEFKIPIIFYRKF